MMSCWFLNATAGNSLPPNSCLIGVQVAFKIFECTIGFFVVVQLSPEMKSIMNSSIRIPSFIKNINFFYSFNFF